MVVEGASLRADRIAERLEEGFLDATTLMEFLIAARSSPRTAHAVIGGLVARCESRGLKRLADLSDAELAEALPGLGPEIRDRLGVKNAVEAFRSYGSTAPEEVERQLEQWKTKLAT